MKFILIAVLFLIMGSVEVAANSQREEVIKLVARNAILVSLDSLIPAGVTKWEDVLTTGFYITGYKIDGREQSLMVDGTRVVLYVVSLERNQKEADFAQDWRNKLKKLSLKLVPFDSVKDSLTSKQTPRVLGSPKITRANTLPAPGSEKVVDPKSIQRSASTPELGRGEASSEEGSEAGGRSRAGSGSSQEGAREILEGVVDSNPSTRRPSGTSEAVAEAAAEAVNTLGNTTSVVSGGSGTSSPREPEIQKALSMLSVFKSTLATLSTSSGEPFVPAKAGSQPKPPSGNPPMLEFTDEDMQSIIAGLTKAASSDSSQAQQLVEIIEESIQNLQSKITELNSNEDKTKREVMQAKLGQQLQQLREAAQKAREGRAQMAATLRPGELRQQNGDSEGREPTLSPTSQKGEFTPILPESQPQSPAGSEVGSAGASQGSAAGAGSQAGSAAESSRNPDGSKKEVDENKFSVKGPLKLKTPLENNIFYYFGIQGDSQSFLGFLENSTPTVTTVGGEKESLPITAIPRFLNLFSEKSIGINAIRSASSEYYEQQKAQDLRINYINDLCAKAQGLGLKIDDDKLAQINKFKENRDKRVGTGNDILKDGYIPKSYFDDLKKESDQAEANMRELSKDLEDRINNLRSFDRALSESLDKAKESKLEAINQETNLNNEDKGIFSQAKDSVKNSLSEFDSRIAQVKANLTQQKASLDQKIKEFDSLISNKPKSLQELTQTQRSFASTVSIGEVSEGALKNAKDLITEITQFNYRDKLLKALAIKAGEAANAENEAAKDGKDYKNQVTEIRNLSNNLITETGVTEINKIYVEIASIRYNIAKAKDPSLPDPKPLRQGGPLTVLSYNNARKAKPEEKNPATPAAVPAAGSAQATPNPTPTAAAAGVTAEDLAKKKREVRGSEGFQFKQALDRFINAATEIVPEFNLSGANGLQRLLKTETDKIDSLNDIAELKGVKNALNNESQKEVNKSILKTLEDEIVKKINTLNLEQISKIQNKNPNTAVSNAITAREDALKQTLAKPAAPAPAPAPGPTPRQPAAAAAPSAAEQLAAAKAEAEKVLAEANTSYDDFSKKIQTLQAVPGSILGTAYVMNQSGDFFQFKTELDRLLKSNPAPTPDAIKVATDQLNEELQKQKTNKTTVGTYAHLKTYLNDYLEVKGEAEKAIELAKSKLDKPLTADSIAKPKGTKEYQNVSVANAEEALKDAQGSNNIQEAIRLYTKAIALAYEAMAKDAVNDLAQEANKPAADAVDGVNGREDRVKQAKTALAAIKTKIDGIRMPAATADVATYKAVADQYKQAEAEATTELGKLRGGGAGGSGSTPRGPGG